MQQTFKKQEKLKKSKLINQLFAEGKSVTAFPIKLIYLDIDHNSPYKIQAGVSASKRNFKRAVDRIKIKRLLREAYRKNKYLIYESEYTKKHIFMFIYLDKKEVDYITVEEKMKEVLHKFLLKNKKQNDKQD
ncbi:MAG: ribonuclease P protein component [Flavobacteriaceae bacterium]|nr:ribonuclease P protein component [Flavobacteriaceae bacterium]